MPVTPEIHVLASIHAGRGAADFLPDMLGGQMLRVCNDYVTLLERGLTPTAAVDRLASQPLEFDPALVLVLARCTVADLPSVS